MKMQNVTILREIIETLERHNEEFTVEKFNSDVVQNGAEQELTSFNIKFDLKQKEKPAETISVNYVQPEEVAPGTAAPAEEILTADEPKIAECVEIPYEPEVKEEYSPKLKKKRSSKKCCSCINCYEKDGQKECCKGLRSYIGEYTMTQGCLEYIEK